MENSEVITHIVKRDGTTQRFDSKKITKAIAKAAEATGEFDLETAKKLTIRAINIIQQLYSDTVPNVENVQDIVEDVLLTSNYHKTAKAYILYRDQHARMREISSKFNVDLVDQYLQKIDWQVNENSNMGYSLQGLNNYISSEISKVYWLNKIYPDNVRRMHTEGDFHLHDLGLLGAYCVGWDLQDLLLSGFTGVVGKAESKPAKHLRTALGQVVNFFYTLQGESAGAQAFSNFDTLLAPFIYYDKLSYDEVKQALQEFLFNVNVPTRVGFQTPFTNLTLDLTVPSYYKDQPVIIGGKLQDKTYGEFQDEMDMLNRAFCEVMLAGDAKGRVFTFPIPTYNFINSDMNPEDARSMCCRLRIDNRELRKRGGGLFGSAPLTGSIGVVTINLPRLGFLSKNEEEFFANLKDRMEVAKTSLEIKRKVIERFTKGNLYPYMSFYLRSVRQRFNEFWKNHFSTIGLVGLNEASVNLIGEDIGSEKGRAFAEKVLTFMRETLVKFQEETGNNYNLEATPAEGTSYRLAKLDKERYPEIKCANEELYKQGHQPFYTNSSQLPVNYTDDVFEMLDLQSSIQSKYTGGTVQHIFTGEKIKDLEAMKKFIKTVCEKYTLPYFSITPTFSVCPKCGYIEGEHFECPKCKAERMQELERQVKLLEEQLYSK